MEIAKKYIAHSELAYNAAKDTQYLKDDCLHFRLYPKKDALITLRSYFSEEIE